MKKFLVLIIGVAALLLATVNTQAQGTPIYAAQPLGTFRVAGATATNIGYVIDCRKQASVAICVSNALSTSATDVQHFAYSFSADGSRFTDAPFNVAALTPVASTPILRSTNISTAGMGYIKLEYFTNAAATAISTNTISYVIKIQSP